jgi:gamma-tubulin complex component 3
MSARRAPARSRRVDDALSQLVDSLLPPITLDDDEYYSADEEDALAAAEERRHRDRLDRAWRTLETTRVATAADNDDDAAAENINNASDLIKRKLLRDNASPDKAVRFSNLYSRLLTQPVLGQKWAILYLLFKLSGDETEEGGGIQDGEGGGGRSRSPLMNEGNLDNMLLKESAKDIRSGMRMAEDDDGPAIGSSVSQRGERPERRTSLRTTVQKQRVRSAVEEERNTPPSRPRTTSMAREATASPQMGEANLTEPTLLRDLPYILQGLSSANVEFSSNTTLKLPTNLSIPMTSLLHTLAEPCLLYKGLSTFVDGSEGGLVSQALRAAIGNELRSYLSLVATLEGEIRRALTAAADETDPKGAVKGAVTLKRCVIWTREATMALRLMSSMVEQSKGTSVFRFVLLKIN